MFVADLFKSRRRLEAENLFLRHQLNIALRRAPSRLRLHGSDRALLVWITRVWGNLLVQQAAVLCLGANGCVLSFPKIISGRIDDVARPEPGWRRCCQTVGRLVSMARLCVKPNADESDCNKSHRRKGCVVDGPRQRSAFDPSTRDARCRSGVRQCRSARVTLG